ncbi:hypothetical protein LRS56_05790 [Pseudomonas poae]|nr:hypothetical protein LRS56_05790 [Pseudomonas poae]
MSAVLFVPEGDSLTFTCPIDDSDNLNVRMEFSEGAIEQGPRELTTPGPRFLVEYEGYGENCDIDCVILKFINFDNRFGQSLVGHISVAISENNQQILFFASVQMLGKVSRIEFQFMLGDSVM